MRFVPSLHPHRVSTITSSGRMKRNRRTMRWSGESGQVAISTFLNDTMKKTYRKHSPAFKTKVVLEALKERETLSELA